MSASTLEHAKALLRETLQCRLPADLRTRINAMLERKRGGTGRKRSIDPATVLRLKADGKSNREIAEAVSASPQAISKILKAQSTL